MSQEPLYEIDGFVVVGEELESFDGATLRVFLEDVSLQDVSATMIDQQVITGINHTAGTENRHPFRLAVRDQFDNRASFAVRAHIDLRGDGQVSVGDAVTTQSYPVLTFGYPMTDLTLIVRDVL